VTSVLALLAAGCASGGGGSSSTSDDGGSAGAGPRDLVTHLEDDGSLVAGLSDPDPVRRLLAARGLARLPAVDPSSTVVGALATESDPEVLAQICFALGRWGESSARELLKRSTSHPSEDVRVAAYTALARLEDDRLTDDLVDGLTDPRPSVRGAAALGLARLDGRRFTHERFATSSQLDARDAALHRAATDDADPGVRWRAAYAVSSVTPRPAHVTTLISCLDDPHEPLVRAFALRGLITQGREGAVDAPALARVRLEDEDPRVATEAGRAVAALGSYEEVVALAASHPLGGVRLLAWDAMAEARTRRRQADLASGGGDLGALNALDADMLAAAEGETSPWVRRASLRAQATMISTLAEALGDGWQSVANPAAELERGRTDLTGQSLRALAQSTERRDREAAAGLLGDGTVRDDDLLSTLLQDSEPAVRAAALPVLGEDRLASLWPRLREALQGDDVAAMGAAASACKPIVESGRAPPWLTLALAEALHRAAGDWELEEARVDLAAALGLPPLDPVAPKDPGAGTLLDTLEAWHRAALDDPAPRLVLTTDRGDLTLELDRVRAPRHVENVLQLAESGAFDGLGFHRVVPDFVVQGLDPRGDGWGTGGRRVPDEFSDAPYLTGTVGMPRVQRPHTGGCQIFMTHLPTPHLDGDYTVFGQVVEGLDVLPKLEVGDAVHRVRRVGS
jgi:cyclophilin family peptidyl-prolyl cis-trans isomerase/HEAT repeat protein